VCDDPDRGSELISLVGYMTLAALQELERREVLAGNSIPNMGYILSLLISVGWVRGEIAGDDFMDHVSWVYRVMAMAEAAGITIGGASGYVHTAEEVGEREVVALQHGAHGPVRDDDALQKRPSQAVGVSRHGSLQVVEPDQR